MALSEEQRQEVYGQLTKGAGRSSYLIVDFYPGKGFSPRASENIIAAKEAYNANFKRKVTSIE